MPILKLKSRCLIMIKIDKDNGDQRRNIDGQVLNYNEANQAKSQAKWSSLKGSL